MHPYGIILTVYGAEEKFFNTKIEDIKIHKELLLLLKSMQKDGGGYLVLMSYFN